MDKGVININRTAWEVFLILIIFSVFSCVFRQNSIYRHPEEVAKKYLYHLNKGEFDKACQYSTETTKSVIQFIRTLDSFKLDSGSIIQDYFSAVDIKCSVYGDKATCTYQSNGHENKIFLVRTNKRWLVDMPKEEKPGY
jgi:hypothetical protein